ncbi:hypothetical protein ACFSQT_06865 [Mesorhizobium calcicola]|uniref:Uncharacterized protein n=1 Tax=Mesorhizobium calcicola TaxID=1300310 RepID=A0ABW4W8Q9_9HYPH
MFESTSRDDSGLGLWVGRCLVACPAARGAAFTVFTSPGRLRLAALEPAGRQFGKETAQTFHNVLLLLGDRIFSEDRTWDKCKRSRASVGRRMRPRSDHETQWSCQWRASEQPAPTVVVAADLLEEAMDRSVGQARWLLAPIFAMAITFLVIGITFG